MNSWFFDEKIAAKQLKIASVTMQCDLDPEVNRKRIIDWIRKVKLSHPDVELILFGETVLGWYARHNREASKAYHQSIAETIPGETTELMSKTAIANNIFISFGMSEKSADDVFNTQVLIDPEGKIAANHRKFNLMESSAVFSPGKIPVTMVDIQGIRTGIIVCSDIQSPLVRKELSAQKPELILGGLASPDDPNFFISGMIVKMFDAWVVTANRYGGEEIYFFDGNMVIGDPLGRLRLKTMGVEQFEYYQLKFVTEQHPLMLRIRRVYVGASLILHCAKNLGMMLAPLKDKIKASKNRK
jgi:predicted amidohydrolase